MRGNPSAAVVWKDIRKGPPMLNVDAVKIVEQELRAQPELKNLVLARFIQVALTQMNQREIPGSQHNPQILKYHQTCSLKASSDEVPWCSSFANWTVLSTGLLGTGDARAISWESWGEECLHFFPGCLVVLRRGSGWQRHIGFGMYQTPKSVALIGGNQGDRVSIATFPKVRISAIRTVSARQYMEFMGF